ncbi:glycosyltransferase family 4 protein [cf. Phormidesmis sp. LEGE 11477]|uniref:glycosyltransferase family 4 protein n=1 Tax=cf. Phormidesmis sp. LEGE 11477 TaxID=1828680 RepID=UPI00187EE321|nr:glycosyltransferase family 4 protein [cf. Phormidesmis sp. LEGE 11477]MBE9061252.1 glycosyltransferase family 4 protein [cf. Phormidesmis sp. LEGE 11477]
MDKEFRLGVVFTHPTQHHGPLWRKLSEQPGLSLKVLYLSDENQGSGDSFLGEKAQAWDVDLLGGYSYEYLKDLSNKVPTKRTKTVISPALLSQVKPQNFDAIFMQSFVNYSYRITAALCKLRGIPLIMQNDASMMSDGRYSRARLIAMAFLYPWMNNLADYWLSCGDHNEVHLRHYGVADRKIVRGCHPVDGDRFQKTIAAQPNEIQQIRQELCWDENTLLYGFMGKYIERKNPFEFIDGIVLAHKRDPRVRGVLFGGGDLENEINQRIAELNGEVINYGFVNQSKVPLYFAALDSFVVTSWIDPHPLVVSEAMVSGTPPILSDRCGNWGYSDTVRHRYNGLVYPCGSAEALAESILTMADGDTRSRYSQNSKQVFSEQDINCEVGAFLEVIKRIQANKGHRLATVDTAKDTAGLAQT